MTRVRRAATLPVSFFVRPTEQVAAELLGMMVVSTVGGEVTEGRIVELGPTAQVLERPDAPYTQQLLANTPSIAAVDGPATVG